MRIKHYTLNEYSRNPEIKRQFLLFLLIGVGAELVCAGFVVDAVVPVLVVWTAMGALHFAESWQRYQRIAALGEEIDGILHCEEINLLQNIEEGELSILENEVNKMLTRLRDQNRELGREKNYLADSLADLSHQLRTPLTSMNLVLSMLRREKLSAEKQQEYYRKLQSLLEQVQWLIEVMLKISRLDADAVTFERSNCRIGELVRQAAAPIEISMELKEVDLTVDLAEEAVFYGDMRWTTEALVNILKNCMEHTPAGGTIHVAARENALYAEIIVTDNGTGVVGRDLPHLFERFYKGENSSENSVGIGLALANRIITKQGGTLKIKNIVPHGVEIAIRFYKDTDLFLQANLKKNPVR